MKKKVLSLILAGAIVAPMASVSNAATLSGVDTNPLDGNVTLNGTVRSSSGTAPAGRLEVEIPSAMSFTVDQDGNFQTATNYSISNKSAVGVDVSVAGFTETNPSGGITVEKTAVKDSDARDKVNLSLSGTSGTVALEHNNTSITKIASIASNATENITLIGAAGKAASSVADSSGVSEDFSILFRITKSTPTTP